MATGVDASLQLAVLETIARRKLLHRNDSSAFGSAEVSMTPSRTSTSRNPTSPSVRVWIGWRLELASMRTADLSGTMRKRAMPYILSDGRERNTPVTCP